MNLEWRQMGSAPTGGAILQIVGDPAATAWAASPAGLFHAVDSVWSSARRSMPLAQVGAVIARRSYILAGGLGGGAAFSLDGGASWQLSRIEQTGAPLSCIIASPSFWQDGVLLAGTQGDGMLRSTDSGRSWQLVNFGLHSFTVFALAAAPNWGRKEVAFCGTAAGVYTTPNGGRAWKPCGLGQQVILALAVSPNFEQDHTLLAGGEGGLYRSQDAGINWNLLCLDLPVQPTVNALWFAPDGRVWMGTSEHGIWCSMDAGISWTTLENSPRSVLCLDGSAERICAGTYDQGLFISVNEGATWQAEIGLAARRFQWLASLKPTQTDKAPSFLAGGTLEGMWQVTDGGRDWQSLPGWQEDEQPLCMAVDAAGLWYGGSNGVWKAKHIADQFNFSLDSGHPISALSSEGGRLWAGSLNSRLWVTVDGGGHWDAITFPGQGGSLLAMSAARDELLLAVRDPRRPMVHIWKGEYQSEQANDLKWELWLSEPSSWEMVRLVFGGLGSGQWVAAVGSWIYTTAASGLQRSELSDAHPILQALIWWPHKRVWLAVAEDGLWISDDLTSWQRLETNLPVADIVALEVVQNDISSLAALTVDGKIWLWRS